MIIKTKELRKELLALKGASGSSFTKLMASLEEKYEKVERATRTNVRWFSLQQIIDETPTAGLSYKKFALKVATLYTERYAKKKPINPMMFAEWAAKGRIKIPASLNKIIVTETTPDG